MQAFIIQARTGSSRMPNKIMLPFAGGLTILDITIRMLGQTFLNFRSSWQQRSKAEMIPLLNIAIQTPFQSTEEMKTTCFSEQ